MCMCGSSAAGNELSYRNRPAPFVITVALNRRVYVPSAVDCQNSTRALRIGLQPSDDRTTPVRTCPVPVFDRSGGMPRPNGPKESLGVGWQLATCTAGAPQPVGAAASAARTTTTPSSRPMQANLYHTLTRLETAILTP